MATHAPSHDLWQQPVDLAAFAAAIEYDDWTAAPSGTP
jgi:hypothetical protein